MTTQVQTTKTTPRAQAVASAPATAPQPAAPKGTTLQMPPEARDPPTTSWSRSVQSMASSAMLAPW